MTSSTSQFIGLEELEPEPCDGTGEDVMSTRVRRKWLKGNQPSRPRRKLLNPGALASIASATARKRLANFAPASDVAAIYMMNAQFHREILRRIAACDSTGMALYLLGHKTSFSAIHEHKQLVFPEVLVGAEYDYHHDWNLNGVERLDLIGRRFCNDIPPHLVHLVNSNKESLKALKLPDLLFCLLPPGLKLEEFCDDSRIPETVDTKLFTCVCYRHVPIHPAFVRTVKADQIHVKTCQINPNSPEMFAQEPENSRVKGLTVTFDGDELVDFHVTRIAQDVAIMYSALELFDVLYRHSYAHRCSRLILLGGWRSTYDAQYVMAEFERALEECRAPFRICFKAFFHYFAKSRLEASEFARLHFDVDLPPACRIHSDEPEHYHLVKETLFDTKSLRMDFKVALKT
ncbi:hypothetical protein AAVH_28151 [Aphelenchoides avenae]|nr:hypothetical protein AAVH_28151 [Aphelenchus avenae]